jgi:guanylate kinase
MPKGTLVIISAPSGTGKSTICRKLLSKRKDLRYSISCTTRLPRPGEKHGKHYFFLEKEEFKRKIARNEFLEWAVVHDNYYGTPRPSIEQQTKQGYHMLLAIDGQGAMAIRRKLPDSILVWVSPPSLETLRERMTARRDASHHIAKRMANSKGELSFAKNYDYFVVNDDLEKAVHQIDCIITAEALRTSRQESTDLAAV